MWPKCLTILAAISVVFGVAEEVHEIDVLPLVPFKPYQLPRMRWTDLNRVLGSKASDKMLTSKPMETLLGKIDVLKEDPKKFKKLSADEVKSLHGDDEFIAEKEVWVAFELLHERDFDAAIALLDQVKTQVVKQFGKQHPLYANALADLGYAYMESGDYVQANKFLVEAMEVDEGLQEKFGVYNTAASINLLATSAIRSGMGDFPTLSNIYESAFNGLHKASHDAQADILLNLANLYRLHWLPLRAINMFKLAKQYVSSSSLKYSDLLLGLGVSYLMEGEFHQGQNVLTSAVDIYNEQRPGSPGHWEAMYYLGTAKLMLGKYGGALELFQAVRKQLPVDQSMPYARAVLMASIAQCLEKMDYIVQATSMVEAAQALLKSTKEDAIDNPLFLPYVQLKLDHLAAMLSKTDATKHAAAYDRAVMLFGETHALAVMHKV
ncbi:hypothetical protein AeMF1_001349 [Aphanomyces euteiches]|nr:hypothetical protein AeMF1_001349 [Aphanomyces euteiches]